MNLDRLIRQVRHNCDVSDARHAGLYSICGLAMRLRDLYKWEQRLPPWQEGDTAEVLDWIGQKEDLWEQLLDAGYEALSLNGQNVDPFDTSTANAFLRPHKLFLGAGYAYSLKPTFFLAEILHQVNIDGHTVWQLGREHARDLLTLPAFSQDGQVVLRTEAGRMFLWDQMVYINKSGRWPLQYALQACGIPDAQSDTLRRHLDIIWKIQKRIYVHHEVGELEEKVFDRSIWRQMLADFPHTPIEVLIRSLKDLLADTGSHGALHHLIQRRDKAALGLYMAFGSSMGRQLAHGLICAFDAFTRDADWQVMIDAAQTLREKVRQYTHQVIEIYHQGRHAKNLDRSRRTIEGCMQSWGLISGK